jgi:hypothetical protein
MSFATMVNYSLSGQQLVVCVKKLRYRVTNGHKVNKKMTVLSGDGESASGSEGVVKKTTTQDL